MPKLTVILIDGNQVDEDVEVQTEARIGVKQRNFISGDKSRNRPKRALLRGVRC